jgi:hypothetical protein
MSTATLTPEFVASNCFHRYPGKLRAPPGKRLLIVRRLAEP